MTTFVARRLLASIPVLILTSIIVFFGMSLVGDPLAQLKATPRISQVTIDNLAEAYHLNEPVWTQYWYWLQDAVGDRFGTYLLSNREIWPDLWRAFKHTAELVIISEVFAISLAILLGVLSARFQYSVFDYATTTVSFFGFSVPIFWFALILQVIVTKLYVATDVRLFYTAGLQSVDAAGGIAGYVDRLQHLTLPVITLAYLSIAQYGRYTRASMLEVLHADYVRTARAKGLGERKVVLHHALRNALIPVVTVAALNLGTLFGGVIITETIFSLDGMGLFFINAIGARDTYALMAWLMVTAVISISFNLLADILYGYLDPRIRYE